MQNKSHQTGPGSDARQTSQSTTGANAEIFVLGLNVNLPRNMFISSEEANRQMLLNMSANGDPLTAPRCVDFDFIFPNENKAKSFAGLVKGKNNTIEISPYCGSDWQVLVSYELIPTLDTITTMELSLTKQAESVGGMGDGWASVSFRTKGTGCA